MNIIDSIDGLGIGAIGPDSMVNADCLEAMALIPDRSIDSIICDLPYGITACKWDVVIPFDRLWEQYKRIIKPNGAIVLFGSQPFTSALVMSNPKWFKYEWIWEKTVATGAGNANIQPMRSHENISVFCQGKSIYYPQKVNSNRAKTAAKHSGGVRRGMHGQPKIKTEWKDDGTRYPRTVIKHSNWTGHLFGQTIASVTSHPTQKPIALIEYLIKTYTIEGELILDNTSGSGTTAIGCINTDRRFICIEKDPHYFGVSCDRVATHDPNAPIVKLRKPKAVPKGQLALF